MNIYENELNVGFARLDVKQLEERCKNSKEKFGNDNVVTDTTGTYGDK